MSIFNLFASSGSPSVLTSAPSRLRRNAEVACYVLGAALVFSYVGVRAAAQSEARADIRDFELALEQGGSAGARSLDAEVQTDFSTWSDARKRAYAALRNEPAVAPLALLEVESVQLKVPVYADSSDISLERGAGVIDGMAAPGQGGNLGIAGHRDGFFRVLKDVEVGDAIEVRTLERSYRYRITAVSIVDETDNSLLVDYFDPTITLVTCYPFYYQGHAPQRFVVQGTLEHSYL
jgi:sortase A